MKRYIKSNSYVGLSYREIYDKVIPNRDYETKIDRVTAIAQLCYARGYKDYQPETKKDAVFLALELYEDMTGVFWDPTFDEFDEIVDRIVG